MEFLREFKTLSQYETAKGSFEYPTVSLVDENGLVYFMTDPSLGIEPALASAADVCLYDAKLNKKIIVKGDNLNNYSDLSRYTPIGVVVVPGSHNVYGDGTCGVMSINPMNYNTPISGGSSEQKIYWGQYGTDTGLPNLKKVNKCGVVSAQTDSVTTTSQAYLPSNKVSGGSFSEADTANTCVHDTDTHYYNSGSTVCIPSPYLSDDSRNPMYYTTSASTANCLSDFDGVGNTNTLVSLHTIDDLSTATTVTNNTRNDCCASGSLLSSI